MGCVPLCLKIWCSSPRLYGMVHQRWGSCLFVHDALSMFWLIVGKYFGHPFPPQVQYTPYIAMSMDMWTSTVFIVQYFRGGGHNSEVVVYGIMNNNKKTPPFGLHIPIKMSPPRKIWFANICLDLWLESFCISVNFVPYFSHICFAFEFAIKVCFAFH